MMRFIEILNNKKFTFISIFLLMYVLLNFFDGERGLISYYEKKNVLKKLNEKNEFLIKKLKFIEGKNILLNDNIDIDYLEILYREKFMVGKTSEKIYIN
mgnify:CR=1 FL=1